MYFARGRKQQKSVRDFGVESSQHPKTTQHVSNGRTEKPRSLRSVFMLLQDGSSAAYQKVNNMFGQGAPCVSVEWSPGILTKDELPPS